MYVGAIPAGMFEDGDRILDLVGVALVVGVVIAVGVVALNFDPPSEEQPPEANWTIERVNDSHVRVTHTGGEPVRTDELRVTVDSIKRDTDWSDPVAEGDITAVDASPGAMVRVVWLGGRGNRVVMANRRV